tara:strand:+ start:446 stop:661 length:216 start_codon:yes stop_codon:yes gene_type:complete
MYISKSRSLIKAISWRIVGTLDTMCLAWLITGSPLVGLKIGVLELATKFIFYYIHERVWLKIKFGTKKKKS